jgi:hypothetical protein
MQKLLLMLIVFSGLATAFWLDAKDKPTSPTADEKLAIMVAVNQYNSARAAMLEQQLAMSNAATQANTQRIAVEAKYNCTYNFTTNECTPNKKEK